MFSYLQRLVANDFSPTHHFSTNKKEYYPSLILNESLFELKVIDLPVVNYFPPDNIAEWTDFKYYGLRSASAYILVYDVSLPSTFQFIKTLREQMFETRDMTNIPVLVVANKMDLELTRSSSRAFLTVHNSNYPSYNCSSHPSHKERDHSQHHHHRMQSNHHHHSHHGGHSSKTEQSRGDSSGGIGGSANITVPVSVTGSSAINVTTCLASDSFHHHPKSSSNSQPTHTISSGMGSKSVPITTHNGATTVSKSTKGNHKPCLLR